MGISGLANLAFFLKEFLENLRRNTYVAITHGLQVIISITVLGFLVIVMTYLAAFVLSLQQMVEVYVYLEIGLPAERYVEADKSIRNLENIESIGYKSPEDALKDFSETFPDLPVQDILEGENPLPPTYIIKPKNVSEIEGLAQRIEKIPGVWQVRYPKKEVAKLMRVLVGVEIGFLLILLLLISGTASSVHNVIRLSIYSRRKEIRIMQLVGATNSFIRWPFLIEGMFIGLVGSSIGIIAILLLGQTAVSLLQRLSLFLPQIINVRLLFTVLALSLLSFGVIGGFISSLLAANRFLASDLRRVEDMRKIEVA